MTTTSHSDDTSDIFWPGYVDAVTNLAINLLFVIAVMSIVALGTNLRISELQKMVIFSAPQKKTTAVSDEETVKQLQEKINMIEMNLSKTQIKLLETEKKLKQKESSAPQEHRTEIIEVPSPHSNDNVEANGIQRIGNGVIVKFAPGAVMMASSQVTELINRLESIGSIQSGHWHVSVISPKGFSETLRLSYYRANAVRNALIESGVPSSAIEMKITESTQPGASNARVLVRLLP